jgi:3,4-dihydroxy 2-butanone 4-phosphate synthase/GTP cyclohydrolase II
VSIDYKPDNGTEIAAEEGAMCCRKLANPNAGANPLIAQDGSVFLSLTGQAVHDILAQ